MKFDAFLDMIPAFPQMAILPIETLAAISQGATQASIVFITGIAVFAAFVCRNTSGSHPEIGDTLLRSTVWMLAGVLLVAGVVALPVYAIRASGESLSLGLMYEALFETRVGHVWMVRLGLGLLAASVISSAIRLGSGRHFVVGFVLCGLLVATLTSTSHASTAGGILPFVSDWLHVLAASVWVGGLLGFPVLLAGPVRKMKKQERAEFLAEAVRRFTRIAAVAVAMLVITGIYASLIHIPSFDALATTEYGRALFMKVGLVFVMFTIGALNMFDRGDGPFERMIYAELILALLVFTATGFLTTLPPPG